MLFSDIEGSTLLLSRLGDRYAEALDGQRSILRDAWSRSGGHEMGTEGDSFFVVFERARDAAAAAIAAQRNLSTHEWPGSERVRVRMGLHTGEPMAHGDGYVGMDVHRAARVAGVAHGGQVVLTDATSRLIASALPDGAKLEDLGEHHLKDLAVPEHLFQLTAEGADAQFPPLRSLGTAAGLPQQPTPLFGRDHELGQVVALLGAPETRLVTLTGPGGSGKTRLSIAAASAVGDAFSDGVQFISLSGATSAEAMWTGLADVLLQPGASRSRDQLIAQVARQRLLLVLDNLEQIPGADGVVADLLGAAPAVTVLATSRRPLHLRAEYDLAVPPLSLQPEEENDTSAAVQLFCLHAQMVRASFVLDEASAGPVEAICRKLDGLPLAIELAAARSRLLSPAALLARLDATWGSPSAADRPERHRTLRDTIAWSHDLLAPELQLVFRRLGAFAGPAELDAVQAVCSPDGDPLDAIADLADASLVQVVDGLDNEPQVSLLQTVHTYAHERLAESGELDETQERHARYFLQLAETVAPLLHTPRQLIAAERLSAVADDLEAALDWTLRPGAEAPPPQRAALGLRLVASLWWYWTANGAVHQRRRWCERAIEVAPEGDSREKAATLHALELQNSHSDQPDSGLPRARIEEALAMYQRLGDLSGMSDVANTLAQLYGRLGDTARARELFERSVGWALEAGDDSRRASALHYFADRLYDDGEVERSVAMIEEGRTLARKNGDERDALRFDLDLANVHLWQGHTVEAQDRLYDLLPGALRVREPVLSAHVVASFCWLFELRGDAERVARLDAAWERICLAFGWRNDGYVPPEEEVQRMNDLRDSIGADAWAHGRDEGSSWSVHEALAYIAGTAPGGQQNNGLAFGMRE
jgi:predicted ATPase/class 3 adenylate cyclase